MEVQHCSKLILSMNYKINEASLADRERLQICLEDFQYINEFTGYNKIAENEAELVLAHEGLSEKAIKENDRIYLVEENNEILAYCKFYEGAFNKPQIFIGSFSVLRKYQGIGKGSEILSIFEKEFIRCKYESIRINVGSKNIKALQFWIKNGFKEIIGYSVANDFLDLQLIKKLDIKH